MADPNKHKNRAIGQLVAKALEHIAIPTTFTDIVEWIVCRTPGDPVELVHSVRQTLAKGLSLGFIDTLQRRYFLTSNKPWHDYDTSMKIALTNKRALEANTTNQSEAIASDPEAEPSAKRSKLSPVSIAEDLPRRKLLVNKNKKQLQRKRKK